MADEPVSQSDALYSVWRRMDELLGWLREHHPEVFDEQKHLDEGSVERAYWHYGYAIAMRDAHAQLRKAAGED